MRKIVPLSLMTCLLLGCGTGHYEELLSKRKADPNAEQLSELRELAGTKVSVRVPRRIGAPVTESQDARYKPGIVTIPGLKQTYEAFIKDRDDGQQPYCCYIGVAETTAGPLQELANKLRTELSGQAQPNQLSEWADYQAETPDGQKVSWRKLRFTGKQPFHYRDKNGQTSVVTMDGTLEIYLREELGSIVVVVWRLPTGIEGKDFANLEELAQQTSGGVSVRP